MLASRMGQHDLQECKPRPMLSVKANRHHSSWLLQHRRNRLRSWKLVLVHQARQIVGSKPHSLWYDCDQFRSFDQTREETESDINPLQPPRGPRAKDVFMHGCATPSRCPTSARPCATVWLRRCPTMTRRNASLRTLHSCATTSTCLTWTRL